MNKKQMIFGFLILLIAWIVAILVNYWITSLPNALDYFHLMLVYTYLLLSATIVYPLVLIKKHYQKKIKNDSEDRLAHVKIDKISLLLALLIAIILTLLMLSTYEHSANGVTQRGIGWHMIEGLSDYSTGPFLVSMFVASTVLFCFELIVSYFVISTLRVWKKSNRVKINWKTPLLAMIIPLLLTGYFSYGLQMMLSQRQEMWDAMTEGQTIGQMPPEVKERYDGQTQATLIGGIATTIFFFCLLTLIFYVVINWVKKRKK